MTQHRHLKNEISLRTPSHSASTTVHVAPSFQEIEVAFRSLESRRGSPLIEDLVERLSSKPTVRTGNARESGVHDPVDELDQRSVESERISRTKIRLSAAIPLTIRPGPEPPQAGSRP